MPDWPYYPVLAKFLEGRGDFGDSSYDAGSHSYNTEPEGPPRAGASHHHPGESRSRAASSSAGHRHADLAAATAGMFLSMSMEEPNEPLACNVDGGRRGPGSSRSDGDSSVSMPESGSSAGSDRPPPNGCTAGVNEPLLQHPLGLGGAPGLQGQGPSSSQIKRRPVSPGDEQRRQAKRPKHGTSSMLLSLMQVCASVLLLRSSPPSTGPVTTPSPALLLLLLLLLLLPPPLPIPQSPNTPTHRKTRRSRSPH